MRASARLKRSLAVFCLTTQATGGFPPGFPHTLPRSVRRRPGRHPCACAHALRATIRYRCEGTATLTLPWAFASPALLSVRVLLRHLWSLVSPTSFSPNGSVVWHSLPSTGSLGHFPCFDGYYGALGLLAARPASLRIPSIGSTFLAKGDDGISQVPGGPWRACLAHRPRWVRCIPSDHSGWLPYSLLQRCCLPLWVDGVGTHI